MRLVSHLMMTFVIVSGLMFGCIPRHPPHTPQPVPELGEDRDKTSQPAP